MADLYLDAIEARFKSGLFNDSDMVALVGELRQRRREDVAHRALVAERTSLKRRITGLRSVLAWADEEFGDAASSLRLDDALKADDARRRRFEKKQRGRR